MPNVRSYLPAARRWLSRLNGPAPMRDFEDYDGYWTQRGAEDNVLDSWIDWLELDETCAQCDGKRLNAEALAVSWRSRSIADYGMLPVAKLAEVVASLKLEGREQEIARDLLAELASRLGFLSEVGLGYLTLDRSAPVQTAPAPAQAPPPADAPLADLTK